jgi:Holliday junction resolvase-like predicted endonuclease
MSNNVKILSVNVWDADTGESDIIFETENNKKLKAFSLDYFDEDESLEVDLSIYCKSLNKISETNEFFIENTNDKYEVSFQGIVDEIISDDESGDIIKLSVNELVLSLYLETGINSYSKGDHLNGTGRLDIETQL